MKILLTTDLYTPTVNGVVTSVRNLYNELVKLGHEVRILTLANCHRSGRKGDISYVASTGAGVVYPGARVSVAAAHNQYVHKAIDWQPDIVHSHCEFSTFQMARKVAKRLNVPLVHTYHTVYEDYTHYYVPSARLGKALASALSRWILNKVDQVVAPTKKVETLLLGYGVKTPITVIPTGIDLSGMLTVGTEKLAELREKLDISASQRVIVSVGRLGKEKNLEEVISLLATMQFPDITLLIVGGGPYLETLQAHVEACGLDQQVVFAGMVNPAEINAYYQLGEVFVSASGSETQGLTYIEALANGIPALCRQDPCLDGVIENGVNGWQYRTDTEFVDYLRQILLDPQRWQELSHNARQGVVTRYSAATYAKSVEQLYMRSIAAKHGTAVVLP